MKFLLSLLLALPLFGKQSERFYQEKFAREIGGKVEVVMKDGTRCDILTATHAIEVDFAKKWAEAIGQSLNYAMHTGKRPMRWFIGREIAFLEACSEYDQAIESSKANVFNYLQSNGPTTARDLVRRRLIKKENRYLLDKWVEEGELIVWDGSNGARPSPTYALLGDDRVPESSSQG